MILESLTLKNFRCYGPEGATINFGTSVTALIGGNGSGKTALLHALMRLFGVTQTQRRIIKRDFHIPADQKKLRSGSKLSLDAIFSFPELKIEDSTKIGDAVPEFFRQMATTGSNSSLKVRIILKANWTDDGTPNGTVEEDIRYARSLGNDFDWENDCQKVPPYERSTIQFIYVPAVRRIEDQVSLFLKGRLWQAAKWSEEFCKLTEELGQKIQEAFETQLPACLVLKSLEQRWRQVHEADTDTIPFLRLLENRFEEFTRKAEFVFYPDEAGQERTLADLSDGQRSLFYIALIATILEVEQKIFCSKEGKEAFDDEKLHRAYLTLLGIEEPENNLSPFFLSRIVSLVRDIAAFDSAQVVLSSHSPAILSRIEPEEVRYFRLDREKRFSSITKLKLPEDDVEASKFVRLAVRAYPELYFARFVILAEGDSEKLVIPKIAEAMGVQLDPSFVPIVPLGGRHIAHFWKLLSELNLPYATLLDLDLGRSHGGANVIRNIAQKLSTFGIYLKDDELIELPEINTLSDSELMHNLEENNWIKALKKKGIFFSSPLDFDFAMLSAFFEAYQKAVSGGQGPRQEIMKAKKETLKTGGKPELYGEEFDEYFKWYPYLFLRRSKPETHLIALSGITDDVLKSHAPFAIKALIEYVKKSIGL